MPLKSVDKAINDIVKYFDLPTRADLLDAAIQLENKVTTPERKVAEMILQSIDGCSSIKEMIEELNTFMKKDVTGKGSEQINQFIQIFTTAEDSLDGAKPKSVNLKEILHTTGNDVFLESKNLSAICINNVKISPANRDTNLLTLFFNSIPTLEFSRAVPILNVEIQTNRAPLGQDGELQTMSLLRFLQGAINVSDSDTNKKLAMANSFIREDATGSEEDKLVGIAGMELFTSPQTLINADSLDDPTLRVAPIIDKFRPFMSIEKLEISVVGAGGLMSYKTGKLHIILHDRSRLAEAADLIRPSLFGHNRLLIEYGWSHPDNTDNNVFGTILNAMRVKEKYTVVNTSYNFDDVGQAKIVLHIAMNGASDFFTAKISQGAKEVHNAAKAVQNIIDEIAEIKESLFKNNFKFMKEIRNISIIDTPSDLTSLPTLKEINQELIKLTRSIKKNSSQGTKELLNKLKELYKGNGKSADRGAIGGLTNTIAKAIRKKMDLVAGIEPTGKKTVVVQVPGIDPVQKASIKVVKSTKVNKSSISKDPFLDLSKTPKELEYLAGKKVSFGKLMMLFIGMPLVEKEKFDDIQFIFYGFNSHAGSVRNKNIAEFLIDVSDFKKKFNQLALKRLSNDIPLWEFLELINNHYFEDFGNENYGMQQYFTFQLDTKTGAREAKPIQILEQDKALNVTREQMMQGIELPEGLFKIPIIEVYTETMPGTAKENEQTVSKDQHNILKIHIFDKQASSYETQNSLLEAARNSMITTIGERANKVAEDKNKHDVEFNRLLTKAEEAGLLKKFGDKASDQGQEKVYEINGGPRKLKEFLYETMPYIVYGTQNSAIKTLGVETMNDQAQVTINMQRQGDAGALQPQGTEQGNLPQTMYPMQMNMNSLGCPVLQFSQMFFVDVQTFTSIDNIYAVVELNHVIGRGVFDTSARLVPFDSYVKFRSMISSIGSAIKQVDSKS